jgi:hypothetical protein
MIVVPVQQARTNLLPTRVQRGLQLMQARPDIVLTGRVVIGQSVGSAAVTPVVIASNPSTFYNFDDTGAFTVVLSVTFAVPPGGGYTAGSWSVNHTLTWTVGGVNAFFRIGTTSGNANTSPTHSADGTYTDGATVTALQLGDINAAAGGNITVTIALQRSALTIAMVDQVLAFTLSLS